MIGTFFKLPFGEVVKLVCFAVKPTSFDGFWVVFFVDDVVLICENEAKLGADGVGFGFK